MRNNDRPERRYPHHPRGSVLGCTRPAPRCHRSRCGEPRRTQARRWTQAGRWTEARWWTQARGSRYRFSSARRFGRCQTSPHALPRPHGNPGGHACERSQQVRQSRRGRHGVGDHLRRRAADRVLASRRRSGRARPFRSALRRSGHRGRSARSSVDLRYRRCQEDQGRSVRATGELADCGSDR